MKTCMLIRTFPVRHILHDSCTIRRIRESLLRLGMRSDLSENDWLSFAVSTLKIWYGLVHRLISLVQDFNQYSPTYIVDTYKRKLRKLLNDTGVSMLG